MIRIATAADEQAIVELATRAWSETPLGREIPADDKRIRRTAVDAIRSPNVYLRVLDMGGIHGLIAGTIVPAMTFAGDVATDLMFYVKPEYRGRGVLLLKGFLRWAFGFDTVAYAALGISSGDERTAEFYQRLGAERVGGVFIVRRKS